MSSIMKMLMFTWLAIVSVNALADTEIERSNPYAMVEQVANKTFARFHQDFDTIQADPDHLKLIVSEELMPYIDYKYASYKVMGSHLRSTTPEQRKQFVNAFKAYLVATYAQAFTEYTNQQVKFEPARAFDGEKMIDVHVQIVEPNRPPIKVQFRVRRLKDDTWKAFDLVAEGVSLLSSKSKEISNLIRQNGIDNVIGDLRARTDDHVVLEAEGN
ncbi:MlaC/ttg2D family ABC transporter substrate-binding protein [Shewanella waksmanii]|uniref:MlaC/ttg2D family ABC transporter substrate-binding protein n=1 Tax=Shewanella waksmanii TaxID=213783 RepID=UPI00048E00A6|nr:ABC transporter substrate-binding protein [Shewanella waksmanii]